jgi:hypothetical protein
MMANHEPASISIGGERVDLEPGEFWTSQESLQKASDLTRKQIRVALANLQKLDFLAIKGAKRGTLITIMNWETYQSFAEGEGHQRGQAGAKRGPTEGQEQECKNEIMEEKTKRRSVDPWNFSDHLEAWKEAYPLVNVALEIKRCKEWWASNPGKVKGRRGGPRSTVVNWLARANREAEANPKALDARGGGDYEQYNV